MLGLLLLNLFSSSPESEHRAFLCISFLMIYDLMLWYCSLVVNHTLSVYTCCYLGHDIPEKPKKHIRFVRLRVVMSGSILGLIQVYYKRSYLLKSRRSSTNSFIAELCVFSLSTGAFGLPGMSFNELWLAKFSVCIQCVQRINAQNIQPAASHC